MTKRIQTGKVIDTPSLLEDIEEENDLRTFIILTALDEMDEELRKSTDLSLMQDLTITMPQS